MVTGVRVLTRRTVTWAFPIGVVLTLWLLLVGGRWNLPLEVRRVQLSQAYTSVAASSPSEVLSLVSFEGKDLKSRGSSVFRNLTDRDQGTSWIVSHLGDGRIPNTSRLFSTTFFLINDTAHTSQGFLEFFGDQGEPWELVIESQPTSKFFFELAPFEMKRVKTAGTGVARAGWARVHASQPLIVAATFGVENARGEILTEVGIPETLPGSSFTLYADMLGVTRTGLALTNPSEEDRVLVVLRLLDADGLLVAETQWDLEPLGHRAQFIDEIFTGVSGMEDFEGSVHVNSEFEFCGITLRATGDQLTSMPMVPEPEEGSEWSRLAFPHVGDGTAGDLTIQTSAILINNTAETASGRVEFFDSTGEALLVTGAEKETMEVEFSIPPGGVERVDTGGSGDLKTGWARVSTDQPIGGTGLYAIRDASGLLLTEVGVSSAPLQQEFLMVADSLGDAKTGLALVNPIPKDDGWTIRADIQLFDSRNARTVATADVQMGPMEHKAVFFDELFPWLEGVGEFEGLILVSGWDYFASTSLRQRGPKLTALPVFSRQYGFSPSSSWEPAQNLAGTEPSYHWSLHQNQGDYAVKSLRLQAPDFGFDRSSLRPLQKIGYGYVAGGGYDLGGGRSQAVDLVLARVEPAEFDLVQIDAWNTIHVLGSGRIEGERNGGLGIEVNFFVDPYSYNDPATIAHFYFAPGILVSPGDSGDFAVTTDFTSVSIRPDAEVVTRISEEQSVAIAQAGSSLTLKEIEPMFPLPGSLLSVSGSGFLDGEVEMEFPLAEGDTKRVPAWVQDDTKLMAMAPEYLSNGTVSLFRDEGSSNPYHLKTLFAPEFRVECIEDSSSTARDLKIVFEQAPEQFAVYWFELKLAGVSVDLGALEVGDELGSVLWKPEEAWDGDEYDLKVDSVEGSRVQVGIYIPGLDYPENDFFVLLEVLEEGTLMIELQRAYPDVGIQMLREELYQSYTLSGDVFDWSEEGEVMGWTLMKSTPTETDDLLSPLELEKVASCSME